MSPLTGRALLVTGGAGSFGHAFVRRALGDGARRVVVFSRDELKQAEMRLQLPDPRLRFFLGDVRDGDRLTLAMHGVEVVVHAAALKRIEQCESDPDEAVKTNVIGTCNVARACRTAGVERAVFLSTDKAPAAHTLYGATKFAAERCWIQSNAYTAGTVTRLAGTRYGNVLGSRGSVLGLWTAQRVAGLPLSVTDETMTRFWMTMGDAVDLVVTALDHMHGGELFIPKCGSASVLDLARAVATDHDDTYAPGHVTTGIRPGERQHETLISSDESAQTFDCGTHYVVLPQVNTWGVQREPKAPRVPCGWSYRSDTNERQLTRDELRRMVA